MTKSRSNATAPNAKGTLVVGNGTDASTTLAVASTAGYLLTVDSSTATGLKWAAPAGGNKTYTLLNTGGTSLSGSSSVQVNVTTKEDYYILVFNASAASRVNMDFRINADSGSNYINCRSELAMEATYSASNLYAIGTTTGTSLRIGTMSSNAGSEMSAGIYVGAGNSTSLHPIEWQGGASASGGTANSFYAGTGFYSGSAAITSFTILAGANFDAGTVYVYGA